MGEVKGLFRPKRMLAGKEELASNRESAETELDSDFFLLSVLMSGEPLPLRFFNNLKRFLKATKSMWVKG